MKKITNYFYEKTGMYIDWEQIKTLPEIDTLIDIGVGDIGTPDLYDRFPNARLILVDPLDEVKLYAEKNLNKRKYLLIKSGVGNENKYEILKIDNKSINRSSLLDVTEINYEGESYNRKKIRIQKLDTIIESIDEDLGNIGIKIDTEGYELNIILGAEKVLKDCQFLIAEVRHNHESFFGQYKLHQFIYAMQKNGFILTKIITAKPLIADLCFEPLSKLEKR